MCHIIEEVSQAVSILHLLCRHPLFSLPSTVSRNLHNSSPVVSFEWHLETFVAQSVELTKTSDQVFIVCRSSSSRSGRVAGILRILSRQKILLLHRSRTSTRSLLRFGKRRLRWNGTIVSVVGDPGGSGTCSGSIDRGEATNLWRRGALTGRRRSIVDDNHLTFLQASVGDCRCSARTRCSGRLRFGHGWGWGHWSSIGHLALIGVWLWKGTCTEYSDCLWVLIVGKREVHAVDLSGYGMIWGAAGVLRRSKTGFRRTAMRLTTSRNHARACM